MYSHIDKDKSENIGPADAGIRKSKFVQGGETIKI